MNEKEQLQEAIGTGTILRVIYNGGSQPGTVREIIPLKIEGNRLFAKCMASNRQKTFSVDKIVFCDEKSGNKEPWRPDVIETFHYETISDFLQENGTQIAAKGWHIESDDNGIVLYGRFKNGNLKKSPDAGLCFDEFLTATVYDPDSGEFVDEKWKKRDKPWLVTTKNKSTIGYGTLDRAARKLLDFVQAK